MALTFLLPKGAPPVDCSSFDITDNTVYGAPNDDRNERANVLFVTRTNKNAVRTLQGIVPNTVDPLTVSSWSVTSTSDGLIEKILFSVKIWVSGGPYVADDIVYDVVEAAFFKCSAPNSSGTRPSLNLGDWGGAAITADSLYTNEIDNDATTMEVVIQNDLNTCRFQNKMRKEWERVADNFIRANGKRQTEYSDADEMDAILQSAYAAIANNRPYEAEEIIQNATNFVLNYGSLD